MVIQAMHKDTLFLTSYEDWTAVEDFSQWGFRAYNSPFCPRCAVMGFLSGA